MSSDSADFAGACGTDICSNCSQRYAAFGLGRGINGAHPNRPLGDLVVCPHWEGDESSSPNNVEVVTPWVRYKQFVTNIWSESKMKAEFRSSLGTDFFKPITVNFDFGVERSRYNKRSIIASGHQIHTRTFRFDLNKIQSDPDAKSGCLAFDCLIEKHLGKEADCPKEPKEVTQDLIEKAERVIENCQGFTHFVAAIHMGARIFEKTTTHLVKDTANIDMGFTGTAAKVLTAKVDFNKGETDGAGKKTTEVIRMHRPELDIVIGAPCHKIKVPPEHECLISYEVLPVSYLIHNHIWRKAVNKACERFIAKQMRGNCTVLLDSDQPFFLVAGDKYLNVNSESHSIELSNTKAAALSIEIADPDSDDGPDPYDAEDVPFHMAFKLQSNINGMESKIEGMGSSVYLYFSMADDGGDERHLKLVDFVPKPSRGQLYLVHPVSHESVPLSKWSEARGHSYAIAVKKGLFKQWYFLVIEKNGHAYFKHDVTGDEQGYHQFKIVGVPPKENKDENESETAD